MAPEHARPAPTRSARSSPRSSRTSASRSSSSSRSSSRTRASMLSESIHSLADTGNQGLLLLGRHARRPAGRRAAPVRLRRRCATSTRSSSRSCCSAWAACSRCSRASRSCATRTRSRASGGRSACCSASMVLEGCRSGPRVHEANQVRPAGESWWQFIRHTKSPDLPVVLLEDAAALVGLVIALVGVVLGRGHRRTRAGTVWAASRSACCSSWSRSCSSSRWAACSSARRPGPRSWRRSARRSRTSRVVRRCIHLRTEHLGPDEIVVATKVEFDHALSRRASWPTTIDALEVEHPRASSRARR